MNGNPENQTSSINPSGENPAGKLPEPSADTLAAAQVAIDQHDAELPSGKRKRGRPPIHGRYVGQGNGKAPPREIPVGKMGNGSGPVLLEENQPEVVSVGVEEIQPAFNAEINRKFAGVLVNGIVSFNNAVKRRSIIKETGNEELADFVVARKTIGAEPREAIELGLVECARKYQVDLSRTPEGMVAFGIIVWQMEEAAQTKCLIAEYLKLRPSEGAKP